MKFDLRFSINKNCSSIILMIRNLFSAVSRQDFCKKKKKNNKSLLLDCALTRNWTLNIKQELQIMRDQVAYIFEGSNEKNYWNLCYNVRMMHVGS